MAAAARKSGQINTVWFNYRRVPAIAFARQLIDEGRIGRVYHFRALYLQDWTMDPRVPLLWRMDKDVAGSGVTGDLHSHIVDHLELSGGRDRIGGRHQRDFRRRARTAGGRQSPKSRSRTRPSSCAKYTDGAIGHFEATRFANGRKNGNTFEING